MWNDLAASVCRDLQSSTFNRASRLVMTDLIQLSSEVEAALHDKRPVVALESTILAHGLPRGENRAVADDIEGRVRAAGAVPATIASASAALKIGT